MLNFMTTSDINIYIKLFIFVFQAKSIKAMHSAICRKLKKKNLYFPITDYQPPTTPIRSKSLGVKFGNAVLTLVQCSLLRPLHPLAWSYPPGFMLIVTSRGKSLLLSTGWVKTGSQLWAGCSQSVCHMVDALQNDDGKKAIIFFILKKSYQTIFIAVFIHVTKTRSDQDCFQYVSG